MGKIFGKKRTLGKTRSQFWDDEQKSNENITTDHYCQKTWKRHHIISKDIEVGPRHYFEISFIDK